MSYLTKYGDIKYILDMSVGRLYKQPEKIFLDKGYIFI